MLRSFIDSIEEVPAALREFYTQREDGSFELETDRSALRNERQHRKAAENRVRELEIQVADLRGRPRPKPDGEMTRKEKFFSQAEKRLAQLTRGSPEYDAEFAKIETEMDAVVAEEIAEVRQQQQTHLDSMCEEIRQLTIKHAAHGFAGAVAAEGCATLLMPHITARLDCQEVEGEWVVSAKDAGGRAISLDVLQEEFRSALQFKGLVRGNTATEVAAHAKRVSIAIGES